MSNQFLDADGLNFYNTELNKKLDADSPISKSEGQNSFIQKNIEAPNHAIGVNSIAFGENCYSGCHGFRIIGWNPGSYDSASNSHINDNLSNTYYLLGLGKKEELEEHLSELLAEIEKGSSISVNLYLKESKDFVANIVSIDILLNTDEDLNTVDLNINSLEIDNLDYCILKITLNKKIKLNYPDQWNSLTADSLKEQFYKSYMIFNKFYNLGNLNIGTDTVAVGSNNSAIGYSAFAAGYNNKAVGKYSTALGRNSEAAYAGLSAGIQTKAYGLYSAAINYSTRTAENGYGSQFAFGMGSQANGVASSAGGLYTKSEAPGSHAFGLSTVASAEGQFVVGKNNIIDNNALFIVGNGEVTYTGGTGLSNISDSNAFKVLKDGRATLGKDPIDPMDVVTKNYLTQNSVARSTKYSTFNTTVKNTQDPQWYRIASVIGQVCNGIFEIKHTNGKGDWSALSFSAGFVYDNLSKSDIQILNHSYRYSPTIRDIRIVVDESKNAYLEINIHNTGSEENTHKLLFGCISEISNSERGSITRSSWNLMEPVLVESTDGLTTIGDSPSINLKPKAVSELPSNPDPNTIYYII